MVQSAAKRVMPSSSRFVSHPAAERVPPSSPPSISQLAAEELTWISLGFTLVVDKAALISGTHEIMRGAADAKSSDDQGDDDDSADLDYGVSPGEDPQADSSTIPNRLRAVECRPASRQGSLRQMLSTQSLATGWTRIGLSDPHSNRLGIDTAKDGRFIVRGTE